MPHLTLFGLTFRGLTLDQTLTREARCRLIVTVNADFIVRAHEGDKRLAAIIDRHVSTFDGAWPHKVARRYFPGMAIEKLSGSDLVHHLADVCIREHRTMLIVGGSPASAALAQERVNASYGQSFCHTWSPPFAPYPYGQGFVAEFRALVTQHRPLAVLLCLGSPSQEFFGEDQLDFLSSSGVAYCMGAGGTVDFLAGALRRAPRFLQVIGLEGVWRLLAQPSLFRLKRLARSARMFRYVNAKPLSGRR
jgi:N-acetylglucosaminyldiphosphoundecaprenol N-acetyl-beta-D-mannosaminyltransferase